MNKVEAGRKQRVLVVDDHPDTTEVLVVLVSMLGHEAYSASRGRDALAIARELEIDLILLDIGLPDINGYEVAHALRSDPKHPRRIVVGISGWGRPEDLARARRAGFDDYLVKPVDLGKIRRVLCRAARTPDVPLS